MCSGSEEGSYSRLIDFVYHSTLGLRVINKKKLRVVGFDSTVGEIDGAEAARVLHPEEVVEVRLLRFRGGLVFKAHRLVHHATLAWRVRTKIEEDPEEVVEVCLLRRVHCARETAACVRSCVQVSYERGTPVLNSKSAAARVRPCVQLASTVLTTPH